ncbi:MAG: peptidyl-prolyl cis-trans isomerase [Gaiellales bacterium]
MALLLVAVVSAGVWLGCSDGAESRPPWYRVSDDLSSDVLLEIDGVPYGSAELAAHLGSEPRFPHRAAAERAASGFALALLLDREAEDRLPNGKRLRRSSVLASAVGDRNYSAEVDEESIRRFYEDHLDRYVHPRLVTVAYVSVPRAGGDREAWRRIRGLRTRWQMIDRSGDLARIRPASESGATVAESGTLPCDLGGRLPDAALPPTVVHIACSLVVGRLSPPIETEGALFVVRVLAERPARAVPLERVAGQIRETLENRARDAAFAETLRGLQRAHDVILSRSALASLIDPVQRAHPTAAPSRGPPPRPPGPEESS